MGHHWIDEARLLISASEVAKLGLIPGNRYVTARRGISIRVECRQGGAVVLVDERVYRMHHVKSGPGHRWFLQDSIGRRVLRLYQTGNRIGSRHELQLKYRSNQRWWDPDQRLKYVRDRKLARVRSGKALLLDPDVTMKTIRRFKPPRIALQGFLQDLQTCREGYRRGR